MNIARKIIAGVVGIGMLAMGLMVMSASKAQAIYTDAINPDNTAQITVTIRPNINRSVTISTDSMNMDLGAVDVTGAFVSTQNVTPATVTIGGTYGNTDLLLSADITGGWEFDASSESIDTNRIATWVSFSATDVTDAPGQANSYFNGTLAGTDADLLGVDGTYFAAARVGYNGGTLNGAFEDNVTTMNNMTLNSLRHMWMLFRMPSETNTTGDQKITFVLTVEQGL